MSNDGMFRSPTFLVGTERQRGIMDEFQKRDQQFSEQYQKNKPLCFSARAYQKTHPAKAKGNHTAPLDVSLTTLPFLDYARQ